jgi:hypothetical protein
MLNFARKRQFPEMTEGAPPGALDVCQDKGWVTEELLSSLEHSHRIVKSSKESPVFSYCSH